MEYLKSLFYPLDTKFLYHTCIGEIDRIEVGQDKWYDQIYLKESPTIPFHIEKPMPENLRKGVFVMINYRESPCPSMTVDLLVENFELIPIKTITNLSTSIMVCCLSCGNKLSLINFDHCNGTIGYYDYDWDLHETHLKHYCDSCGYGGSMGTKCRKTSYRCANCYAQRVIRL